MRQALWIELLRFGQRISRRGRHGARGSRTAATLKGEEPACRAWGSCGWHRISRRTYFGGQATSSGASVSDVRWLNRGRKAQRMYAEFGLENVAITACMCEAPDAVLLYA
jgi:hypothetical protein